MHTHPFPFDKRGLAFVAATFLVAGMFSCTSSKRTDRGEIDSTSTPAAHPEETAMSINRLGESLYDVVGETPGNVFFSPSSVASVLGMIGAGAAGETREEFARVLFRDPARGTIPVSGEETDGGGEPSYRLVRANRLWSDRRFPILESYTDALRRTYNADLITMDFVGQPEPSRQAINAWVEEQTEGKIRDLLPADSIDDLTRLVATNAIYFKGFWKTAFDPEATRDAAFHLTANETVEVPTMSASLTVPVLQTDGVSVVALPYRGDDLDMVFLIPDRLDGLGDLEARLDTQILDEWLEALGEQNVWVSVPRFTIEAVYPLKSPLLRLGLTSAFSSEQADFTGISPINGFFLSNVYHKTYVRVDEEGTEAAAATGGVMSTTSLPPEIRVDRPALFFIRRIDTGERIFWGRLVDPRE